jgi:hypothetical protein
MSFSRRAYAQRHGDDLVGLPAHESQGPQPRRTSGDGSERTYPSIDQSDAYSCLAKAGVDAAKFGPDGRGVAAPPGAARGVPARPVPAELS